MAVAASSGEGQRGLVAGILDVLQVTDRVFFDLNHTVPLVEELVRRAERLEKPGRALVVVPNSLLAIALQRVGYEVELWNVPDGSLAGEAPELLTRTAPLEELLSPDGPDATYDLIVLPYVLEASAQAPANVLARFRKILAPGGRILVAHSQSGAAGNRLRALAGGLVVTGEVRREAPVSLSWPMLPVHRCFGPTELRSWCLAAGLRVRDQAFVHDRRATVPIRAMRVGPWLAAHGLHAVKSVVPSLRDCAVAELELLPAEQGVPSPQDEPGQRPYVTVILASDDSERAERFLAGLSSQTYPRESFEVILVHPPGSDHAFLSRTARTFPVQLLEGRPPHGPEATNLAVRKAAGRVLAFTDDRCRVPAGWIEAGVASLSSRTAAATGELRLDAGSPGPFLELPGARAVECIDGTFPIANAFFSKRTILDVGGFDERFQSAGAARWGWDSHLVHRLKASGYRVVFEQAVSVDRRFPTPRGRGGWIGEEYRHARQVPAAMRDVPAMAGYLPFRLFASRRTMYFDLLVLGTALALKRRSPGYMCLGLPWAREVVRYADLWPPAAWRPSVRVVRGIAARHVVWCAGLVAGSLRARRVVL